MEVFTGDHGLPNDVVLFPDAHFSPYALPTADTFSDHKLSADHDHFLPLPPPQKLRPIRGNVRTFSDDPIEANALSWQSEAALDNNGTDGGSFVPPNCSDLGLQSEKCQIENALSSSSEETSKLQEPVEEPVNTKKRKRKSRKKMELFIESMMKTVIEKQEEMHKQLIDMLEKKEKESIMREQKWKKQEIERAKRDEQARKQQVSQSLALISFIQNTLGQEIQIPNFDNQNLENQENLENLENHENLENPKCDGMETTVFEESDARRWPKSEVQALITVRAALNQKFNEKGPKGSIWDEVAAGLSGMGYNRTSKKCKEKWENINKYYRRTMEKGKERSKSCAYFRELEMLHKTGLISTSEDRSVKGVN